MSSYSLATDHLQKTVFHYVDVMRQLYPAWSPDTGVFPFSMSDSSETDTEGDFLRTSYAASVDAGVRAQTTHVVSDRNTI